MAIEPKDWMRLQVQKGRETPAAHIVISGSQLREALRASRISSEGLDLENLEVRRIPVRTRERKARIILEIRQADGIGKTLNQDVHQDHKEADIKGTVGRAEPDA